jgi:hypothetical protein
LFAHYIDRETYREPFRKLLDEVTASGIMKNRVHIGTLRPVYVALESYRIHEEGQVSEFMKNMLFAAAEIGTPEDQKLDEKIGLKLRDDPEGTGEKYLEDVYRSEQMYGMAQK